MFASDRDDDTLYSPSGDLEDDSLLDEAMLDAYDEDEEEDKDNPSNPNYTAIDDEEEGASEDDDDLDDDETVISGEE